MSAATPLLAEPADAFAWLPPHMRPAARRHGFGLRDLSRRLDVPLFGTLWYTDVACAVDSGIATDELPSMPWEREIEGEVLYRDRWTPATPAPMACGCYVRIGTAIISAAYRGLVEELHPGAAWEAESAERPVVARVAGRPVAIVAPVRP